MPANRTAAEIRRSLSDSKEERVRDSQSGKRPAVVEVVAVLLDAAYSPLTVIS